MAWFFLLIPTTAIVAGGYIVLVLSRQTEGALKTFGKYLAVWIFILAGLFFIGANVATIYRGTHQDAMGRGPWMMHHGMMGRGAWGDRDGDDLRRSQPAPETQAPPAPSSDAK